MKKTVTSEEYVLILEKLIQTDKQAALDFAKNTAIVDTYVESISSPFKGKVKSFNVPELPKDLHIII